MRGPGIDYVFGLFGPELLARDVNAIHNKSLQRRAFGHRRPCLAKLKPATRQIQSRVKRVPRVVQLGFDMKSFIAAIMLAFQLRAPACDHKKPRHSRWVHCIPSLATA